MSKILNVDVTVKCVGQEDLIDMKKIVNDIVEYDPMTFKIVKAKTKVTMEQDFHIMDVKIVEMVEVKDDDKLEIPKEFINILNNLNKLSETDIEVLIDDMHQDISEHLEPLPETDGTSKDEDN